jgi:hypothetical protein
MDIDTAVLSGWDCTITATDKTPTRLKPLPRSLVTLEQFPRAPQASLGALLPVVVGRVESSAGALSGVLVDTANHGTWALVGHASRRILQVYVGGVLRDPAEYTVQTYASSAPDSQGQVLRYTSVSPLVAWGMEADVRVNLEGFESVGDGTGVLLENPADVLQTLLRRPEFWGLSESELDLGSFESARAIYEARGYRCAGVIPFSGSSQESAEAVISQLMLSSASDFYWSRDGKFRIRPFPLTPDPAEAVLHLTDFQDVYEGSFRYKPRYDQIINSALVFYRPVPSQGRSSVDSAWEGFVQVRNPDSVLRMKNEFPTQLLLWFVPTEAQAIDVAARWLFRVQYPMAEVQVETGPQAFDLDLGSIYLLSHAHGIGPQGWTERPLYVVGLDIDLSKMTTRIHAIDLTDVGEGFVLGDESEIAATWETASASDRQYGYLASEETLTFSDGAFGKVLLEETP